MPKVRLHFEIQGWITQTVEVPQAIIDQYKRETSQDDFDGPGLDRMLGDYVRYDDIIDQLGDPEDVELTELKSPESATLMGRERT